MREINVVDFPLGGIIHFVFPVQCNAEKRELVSEGPAGGTLKVAGVIPPLDAKIVVRIKITGESVLITGKRRAGTGRCGIGSIKSMERGLVSQGKRTSPSSDGAGKGGGVQFETHAI